MTTSEKKAAPTTAAQVLADCLVAQGVDRAFCVPGESYLALLNALYDRPGIQVVTCRHESGAGYMAVADAKLTGRPGVCMVSRGPGATNAAIAVHTAQQDAVPLVLFVGQVERKDRGRGAFQEMNYPRVFGDSAKWVWEVSDAEQLPEVAARGFLLAQSGTPGPVVIVLPEDMLTDACAAPVPAPNPVPRPAPGPQELDRVAAALAKAERPLLVVGSALRGEAGIRALRACSEAWHLPVALTFKQQHLFDNDHPNYAGHLGYGLPKPVLEVLVEADLILAVGTRLGDVSTQNYAFPRAPEPEQPLIHVHADPMQIGRVFGTAQSIVADAEAFLAALAEHPAPQPPAGRAPWIAAAHELQVGLRKWTPVEAADGVAFGAIVVALAEAIGEDSVIAMDAGNFNGWIHRYFPFNPRHVMVSAVSGAMGLGVPAAVAAALRHPDRPVVGFIGDGGFLMTGNELATAVQHGAKIRLFVANNGSYGTIRLHQERAFPDRVIATDLRNPDFAALAEAFGAQGLRIAGNDDVAPAVRAALAADGPVVVDVRTSLRHITAFATLDDIKRRQGKS